MKLVCCLVLFAIYTVAHAKPPKNEYNTKYDNLDLDSIFKNDRLLRNYVDCLLGSKKCTKEGEELKSKLIVKICFVLINYFEHFIISLLNF